MQRQKEHTVRINQIQSSLSARWGAFCLPWSGEGCLTFISHCRNGQGDTSFILQFSFVFSLKWINRLPYPKIHPFGDASLKIEINSTFKPENEKKKQNYFSFIKPEEIWRTKVQILIPSSSWTFSAAIRANSQSSPIYKPSWFWGKTLIFVKLVRQIPLS